METTTKSIGKIKPATLSSLFDPFFRRDINDWFGRDFMDTTPGVNISETNGSYHVELAAPGLKKEDFNIKVDGDMITISSEKETEKKTEEKNYYGREYNYTSFSRSFNLPAEVNQEKITANYTDGVLKLELPKKEVKPQVSGKKINVQ